MDFYVENSENRMLTRYRRENEREGRRERMWMLVA